MEFGDLLQYWRRTRNLSQLALAGEADVSSRHVCFLETGRAKPSQEMVLQLATVLDVPLRERNELLLAAGFAPLYREASLDAPELEAVRAALDAILKQQEPFPAVVMNRQWDIVETNKAASRFFALFLGNKKIPKPNVLRLMFDEKALRPHVANWEAVAESLIMRVQREATAGVKDPATLRLLDEILSGPNIPRRFHRPNRSTPLIPVVPVCFRKGRHAYDFFSTVTTLGTPQDVTLQELRIECFFPADEATRRAFQSIKNER